MTWIASFGRSGPEGEGRRGLGQRGKGGEVWARGGREERSGPEGEGGEVWARRGKGGVPWGGKRSGSPGGGRRWRFLIAGTFWVQRTFSYSPKLQVFSPSNISHYTVL